MSVNQVLLQLAVPSELQIAHRTRELRFLTALFALVSRQRRFPRVLPTADVADVQAPVPLVVVGFVTWKESTSSAGVLTRP